MFLVENIRLILGTLYLVAAMINHIDDTDETYGYYEPLHYLLYGSGMQTWEYDPSNAIRSYAFLLPLYIFGLVVKPFAPVKIMMFFNIRMLLGQFMAIAQTRFLRSIEVVLGPGTAHFTAVFMLASPGLFLCSTSFLPSAVGCSLVMYASSFLLNGEYVWTVFMGCLAVMCTGWPFVGVIFLPFGIQILQKSYSEAGMSRVINVSLYSIIVVFAVFLFVFAVDSYYYGRKSFSPLNILLYNAITGSGDELYGIEPASYYVKNLILTVGFAFPLGLLGSSLCLLRLVLPSLRNKENKNSLSIELTLFSSAFLWIALLFSRPHKEERFMYPVYPLMCLLAALFSQFITDSLTGAIVSRSPEEIKQKREKVIRNTAYSGCLMIFATIAFCRIFALKNNYGGYIKLWTAAEPIFSKASLRSAVPIRICMGSDWYTFPSHFFLPPNTQLDYFNDGFKGILPQHFAAENGTFCKPIQPFNGLNKEETSRYVELETCDYIVRLGGDQSDGDLSDNERNIKTRFISVMSTRIIDPSRSHVISRIIAIPGFKWLDSHNVYREYSLFKNKK